MEIEQVKSTLKKILDLLDQSGVSLQPIEKDLILSYLRNIYDEIFFDFPNHKKTVLEPKQNIVVSKPIPEILTTGVQEEVSPIVKMTEHSEKFDFLFSFSSSNDLSEKLSLQNAKDLSKSFSLNDKLWYTNELFKKDANEFQDSIQKLNFASSMEAAKNILISLAEKNRWDLGDKKEAAIMFCKIVLTRFL